MESAYRGFGYFSQEDNPAVNTRQAVRGAVEEVDESGFIQVAALAFDDERANNLLASRC